MILEKDQILDPFSPPPAFRRLERCKKPTYAPNQNMHALHGQLIRCVRGSIPELPSATACRPGCSPLQHVLRHEGNRYFYVTDLVNAFGNVSSSRLIEVLLEIEPGNRVSPFRESLSLMIEKWCFHGSGGQLAFGISKRQNMLSVGGVYTAQGLTRGGPASPELFNLYAEFLLDQPIRQLLGTSYIYSRYLDDLVVSGQEPIPEALRRELRRIVEAAGFTINHRKSHVWDLRVNPVVITGVGIKPNWRTYLPREKLRKISGLLHQVCADPAQTQISHQVIRGELSYFLSLTSQPYNRTEMKVWGQFLQYFQIHKERPG